jgi:hypothetical protein
VPIQAMETSASIATRGASATFSRNGQLAGRAKRRIVTAPFIAAPQIFQSRQNK